jgi:hypothetical protein
MTGPLYPPPPEAGSNAIGQFIIGVSPIGTIEPFDFWSTIISQYANSDVLTTLIGNFNDYLDQTANMENFFDFIWNVNTAQGYGLDIWGKIVDVSRVLRIVGDTRYLGFEQALPDSDPFNQSSFFAGATLTSNFSLSDAAYRALIFAKALFNITDGSIPSINQILLNLFPNRGNCYVIDNLDMSMIYKFNFILTPVELAIVQQSGALPKPTGVSFTIEQLI